MKTKEEIQAKIAEIEKNFAHVLIGSSATIHVNAPRAVMQLSAITQLQTLHWMLGTTYKSKLRGTDT